MEGGVVLIGLSGKRRSGKTTVANHLRDSMGFMSIAFADPLKPFCASLVNGILNPFDEMAKTDQIGQRLFVVPDGGNLPDYLRANFWVQLFAKELGMTVNDFLTQLLVKMSNQGVQFEHSEVKRTIKYPEDWTFGTMLQKMGTEVMREGFAEDIWVRCAKSRMMQLASDPQRPQTRFVMSDVRYLNEEQGIRDLGGHIIKLKADELPGTDADGRSGQHRSEMELERIVPDIEVFNDMTERSILQVVDYVKQKM